MLKYLFEKFLGIFSELIYFICERKKESGLPQKFELKFKTNGIFKIVQFTDLHERTEKNEKTINLMKNVMDSEKPDLILLTGDCIDGRYCRSRNATEKAIHNIASTIEATRIPWAVVLGNHDCELSSVNREEQMKIYMSYDHNLSGRFSTVIGRAGDYNLLINDSKNTKPILNIFMMDSGDYCYRGYDYITRRQIRWYERLSENLEKKFHEIIPSLIFFHIPLQQQKKIGLSGHFDGSRNELECTQSRDRGFFDSLKKVGNVKGVFCGHDHTNDYQGHLDGITLGYGRCTGYNGYGKEGFPRGARVYIIDEKKAWEVETYAKQGETN